MSKEKKTKLDDESLKILAASYTVYAGLCPDGIEPMPKNVFLNCYLGNLGEFTNLDHEISNATDKEKEKFTEERAKNALQSKYYQAWETLNNSDKMDRLLQRLENKMKIVPVVGDKLSNLIVLAEVLNSYAKKEYTDIPIGSMLAIISALIYFVSPFDILPDSIPVLGYFDDAAVVGVCWKLVDTDVQEYLTWRAEQKENR